MKKSISIIIAFVCLMPMFALSQPLSGWVKDSNADPIPYVTVVLLSQNDSSYIAGTITDNAGYFVFDNLEIDNDTKHIIHLSSIGYITTYAQAIPDQTITLQDDVQLLGEITLKAERPISRLTADGQQTTVAHTVLAEMGTGNDVLKHIPMVDGDDGVYEVFGRGEAKIFINGREVRDATEIERINSQDIKNVEVITNPGARYDASVAAVINITTIKKQGDGFSINARTSAHTWENQDYMAQVNMNYRYKGLDLFANVNYINGSAIQLGPITTTNYADTLWVQNAYIDGISRYNYLYTTLGMNYNLNSKHSVGFRYTLTSQPQNAIQNSCIDTEVFADGELYDNWVNTSTTESSSHPKSEANVYYRGEVDKLGVDFNATYLGFKKNSWTDNIEESELYGESIINSTSYNSSALWATKLQLSYPLWKGEIMVGAEYTNISLYDEYINDDLPDFSSNVEIAEQNIATYVQYQAQTKGGNFSVGLRYENAAYEYYTNGILSADMSKVYNQLFPSASYSINIKEVGLQLAYTSKVQRPTYDELSSNVTYANQFLLQSGNAYLLPSINHNVSAVGVWRFIQASVSYTYQTNAIQVWMDQYENDPKVTFLNYVNLDEAHKFNVYIAVAPQIKFWQPQWHIGLQKAWYDFEKYGLYDISNTPIVFGGWDNAFVLPYDMLINLDASFQSKGSYMSMYVPISRFVVDFAFSKSFLNKSLRAKVGIDDIFYNNLNAATAIFPNIISSQLYENESRKVYFTLSYFFNQTDSKYKGSKAGEDAIRRL